MGLVVRRGWTLAQLEVALPRSNHNFWMTTKNPLTPIQSPTSIPKIGSPSSHFRRIFIPSGGIMDWDILFSDLSQDCSKGIQQHPSVTVTKQYIDSSFGYSKNRIPIWSFGHYPTNILGPWPYYGTLTCTTRQAACPHACTHRSEAPHRVLWVSRVCYVSCHIVW